MLRLSSLAFLAFLTCSGFNCGSPTVAAPTVGTPPVVRSAAATAKHPITEKSLATLRKLDDSPLYAMTWYGDYDAPQAAAAKGGSEAAPYGCSLFIGKTANGGVALSRNFDWPIHPSIVLVTHPEHGYSSISVVDLSVIGDGWGDLLKREKSDMDVLALAPKVPIDGMNEKGLAVGMAAVPDTVCPKDPAKKTVGTLGAIRMMLDNAATTQEAIKVLQSYNVDFTKGPQVHYLVVDKSGESAILEFLDGKLHVLPGERAMTNFHLADEEARKRADYRYRNIEKELAAGKAMTKDSAFSLMSAVAQPNTRWSAYYDLATGTMDIASVRNYSKVEHFSMND